MPEGFKAQQQQPAPPWMEIFVVSDLEEAPADPPWETNSAAETEFSFETDIQLTFSQNYKFVLPDLQILWLYYHYYLQYFFKCQDVKFGGSRNFFFFFLKKDSEALEN